MLPPKRRWVLARAELGCPRLHWRFSWVICRSPFRLDFLYALLYVCILIVWMQPYSVGLRLMLRKGGSPDA
jgi:hypothetical protein